MHFKAITTATFISSSYLLSPVWFSAEVCYSCSWRGHPSCLDFSWPHRLLQEHQCKLTLLWPSFLFLSPTTHTQHLLHLPSSTDTHPSSPFLPSPTFHTQTLCLLPPGPGDYLGERCIHSCLPTLHLHTITDPSKAPCLTALLKNLHHVLLDQYQYEEVGVVCDSHMMSCDHDVSQYF